MNNCMLKKIFKIKLYDCFIFFNELELLDMRFNILYPYVDHFVIVEATKTHAGKDKPLYFWENSQRFGKFKDKVVHIIVENMPEFPPCGSRIGLEFYQRNQIRRGLYKCADNDIIAVSDIDEIPNPLRFYELIFCLNAGQNLVAFRQLMFYYYLNGFLSNSWYGTRACKFSTLSRQYKSEPNKLRFKGPDLSGGFTPAKVIERGGWHFSYLGGVNRIIEKLESFSHGEYDNDKYKQGSTIKRKLESGDDLFDRGRKISYIPIDKRFPNYLLNNIDSFQHLINKS